MYVIIADPCFCSLVLRPSRPETKRKKNGKKKETPCLEKEALAVPRSANPWLSKMIKVQERNNPFFLPSLSWNLFVDTEMSHCDQMRVEELIC